MGAQIADGKVDAAAHMLQQGDLGAGHIVKGGGMLQDGEIAGFLDVGADGTDEPAEVQALEKISVRGLGKIRLTSVNGRTKKDRISVTIHRFI